MGIRIKEIRKISSFIPVNTKEKYLLKKSNITSS